MFFCQRHYGNIFCQGFCDFFNPDFQLNTTIDLTIQPTIVNFQNGISQGNKVLFSCLITIALLQNIPCENALTPCASITND